MEAVNSSETLDFYTNTMCWIYQHHCEKLESHIQTYTAYPEYLRGVRAEAKYLPHSD